MGQSAGAVLSLWVAGTPRPKQSGRIVGGRGGPARFVTHATANKPARLWRERVEREAREARRESLGQVAGRTGSDGPGGPGAGGSLRVRLRFVFPTRDRTRWGLAHTARPDADNLAKLAVDALSAAGVIGDDAKVARLEVVKVWGPESGKGMGVEVWGMGREAASEASQDGGRGEDGVPDWLLSDAGA